MIKRISSGGTFFFKLVFPALFLIPGTLVFVAVLLNLSAEGIGPLLFSFIWLIMVAATFGLTYFRLKLVSVDETHLYISNYFKSITVSLAEVAYIEKKNLGRGYLVWIIHLERETAFGREIWFTPVPDHTLPDRGSAEDLVKKIPAW